MANGNRQVWIVTSQPSGKFLEVFASEATALNSVAFSYHNLHVSIDKMPLSMQPGWQVEVTVHDEGKHRVDTLWVKAHTVMATVEHL